MSRTLACIALITVGAALAQEPVTGQAPEVWLQSAATSATAPPLLTRSDVLRASLQRIAHRSALWREAVETVRRSGRHALVLTPDQVTVADPLGSEATGRFDATVLAEVAPVPGKNSSVDVVLVVVNLPLLEKVHQRTGSLPVEFQADLDRILVHEIYGHALPYLLVGDLSGRCADPGPRQAAADACAIQRENAVRAELGFVRRTDYGIHDLLLTRRSWP